jgi:hypothetical protein
MPKITIMIFSKVLLKIIENITLLLYNMDRVGLKVLAN